ILLIDSTATQMESELDAIAMIRAPLFSTVSRKSDITVRESLMLSPTSDTKAARPLSSNAIPFLKRRSRNRGEFATSESQLHSPLPTWKYLGVTFSPSKISLTVEIPPWVRKNVRPSRVVTPQILAPSRFFDDKFSHFPIKVPCEPGSL